MLGSMKNLRSLLAASILSLSVFCLFACSSLGPKKSSELTTGPKTADEVSIMNFNVENLFDNIHDENREDFTYLPLKQKQTEAHKAICAKILQPWYKDECLNFDWNDEIVTAKLKNLSEVILSVEGQGPDILVLQEVENDRILSRLNKEYLAKAGYQTQVLIEGPDTRGIDIGVLSRFPLVGSPTLHKIPYKGKTEKDQKGMNLSRGVLEVNLKLPNQDTLTVLGAHFPSQGNPRYWREQSVQFLTKLMREKSAKNMVVASGDLNITHEEEQETGFFGKEFSQVALVSHLVGCKKCEGSHNYRKSWSFLDVILFSKNLGDEGTGSYKLETESITTIKNPIHLFGSIPKRFKPENKEGVSDHLPLYSRLVLRKPAK